MKGTAFGQAKAAARQEDGDEMIISAGDFLIRAVKPAAARLYWEHIAISSIAAAAFGNLLPSLIYTLQLQSYTARW